MTLKLSGPTRGSTKLRQQVDRARYQGFVASLDLLPKAAGPSGLNDVFGGI